MKYQDYKLSHKRLVLASKHLAKRRVKDYIKQYGVEPPKDVESTFYYVSQEEQDRYRDAFFASDFVKESNYHERQRHLPLTFEIITDGNIV